MTLRPLLSPERKHTDSLPGRPPENPELPELPEHFTYRGFPRHMKNTATTDPKEATPPNPNKKHRVWIRLQASLPDGSIASWGDNDYELNLSPLISFQLRFKISLAVKEARLRQRDDDRAARLARSRRRR
jgi:hypothetical protein